MRKGSSKKRLLLIVSAALVVWGSFGCSHQHASEQPSVSNQLPEEIFIKTPLHMHYGENIVVCDFRAPENAGRVDTQASRMLFSELLKRGLTATTLPPDRKLPDTPDQIARMMQINRYGMLVMGEVTFFLDGMNTTDSRVESEMVVYTAEGTALRTVGYARAIESAPPKPSSYWVAMHIDGQPAPYAKDLLKRNSAKFARMIEEIATGH